MARTEIAFRLNASRVFRCADQCLEKIDIVIVMHTLQNRRDAFQTHARINRRTWQIDALLRRELLELHENKIPNFDETIAVFICGAGRATPDMIAMIVEDFRTRTAGAGITHCPEIVARRNADDAIIRKTGDLLPEIRSVVICVINGDKELIFVEAKLFCDQVPRMADRFFLEVVAKGEITEHFKERVVTSRVADIVQIVVLAAGAHAFLRSGRAAVWALFKTGKDVLELHHARIGEHECWVVARHQRA